MAPVPASLPLSTLLSQVLVAQTIELDNEFEARLAESGAGARVTSVVMWSNFLRFVGEGIMVGGLPAAAGLPKQRVLSNLGGMERWRYVFVAPAPADHPPGEKREGWGSSRGLRSDWLVRPTAAGRATQAIRPALFGELEDALERRFGAVTLDELRSSSRALVARLDFNLPEYVPIVASGPHASDAVGAAASSSLTSSLAQVLLAHTLDFEERSELSLALSANFVRVLSEDGTLVRDIPVLAGVSKEATAMALGFLGRAGYTTLEGSTAATRRARLTAKGTETRATASATATWTDFARHSARSSSIQVCARDCARPRTAGV